MYLPATPTVDFYDCARFCNALSQKEGLKQAYRIGSGDKPDVSVIDGANGYRLPTEAQWEYAAKAGTELTYVGSDSIDEVGWYDEKYKKLTQVLSS